MLISCQQEVLITQPKTSPLVVTSIENEVHKKVNDKQETQEAEEGNIHKEKHPVPAPRSQKCPPFSPKDKRTSLEKIGSNGSTEEPHQNTPEHRELTASNFVPKSETDSQAHQSHVIDSTTQQKPHSRSGSVSSTGTYNVEDHNKSITSSKSSKETTPRSLKSYLKSEKMKRSNSEGSATDSSTRTYNVESPKISRNVSGASKTDDPKSPISSKSKTMNSEASSGSSEWRLKNKRSTSASSKKSFHSKSFAQARERLTSENPEEAPSTSHSHKGVPDHLVTITTFLLTLFTCIMIAGVLQTVFECNTDLLILFLW